MCELRPGPPVDGRADEDFEAILVGAGGNKLGAVADTRAGFAFFGFDTSINQRREVTFKTELDGDGAEGLFSGRRGGPVTTHYLNTSNDSRPSINDSGQIAFSESVDFAEGIFAGADGEFGLISPPSQDIGVGEPEFNNVGAAAYERSFTENEGFRPPALNDHGDVAFFATLDTPRPGKPSSVRASCAEAARPACGAGRS